MRLQKVAALPTALPLFLLACGALVIFASSLYPYFVDHLGHDQTSYLFEAQRELSGATPYGPFLSETNPPVIIWFSAIPVQLATWLHASPILLFRVVVLAMIFASIAWCLRLLRHSTAIAGPVALALFGCATLATFLNIGTYEFGQREHLLIIFILPYLLAAATGAVSRISFAERCVLGAAAGIAIWFKPHDTLILVGLELFLALRTRSLRRLRTPEFLSLLLTGFVLLVLVRLFTPLYLEQTYPLLRDTYWAVGTSSTLALIATLHLYIPLILVLLLACFLLRRSLRDPETSAALLVCGVFASLAFAVQHTTWNYHRYPHRALLLLALTYFFIDLVHPVIVSLTSNSRLVRGIVLGASAVSALILCVVAIRPGLANFARKTPRNDKLDVLLKQYQPPTTVYVFSTSVPALADVYTHRLNWGSRFVHLWMMPAIIQNELGPTGPPAPFKQLPPDTVDKLATLQRTETADDLSYWRPSVVFVQKCTVSDPCQGIEGKNFDYISWFLRSPRFAAVWSHYRHQASVANYDIYKLVPSTPSDAAALSQSSTPVAPSFSGQ